MAGKVLTFEDFEREQKRREFKEKIYVKIQNGKDWIIRNKEAILILTPIAIKGCRQEIQSEEGRRIERSLLL